MAHSALVRASRIGDAEATPLYPPGQKPPERHPAGTAGFPGISRQSGGWPKSNVFGQSGLATFCVHLLREGQLHATLRELGRIILEWTYNHIEPDDRRLMPSHLRFDGDWYRRRAKTPNRCVATLFGTITLWRYLYQPIHGVERSIFPLGV